MAGHTDRRGRQGPLLSYKGEDFFLKNIWQIVLNISSKVFSELFHSASHVVVAASRFVPEFLEQIPKQIKHKDKDV